MRFSIRDEDSKRWNTGRGVAGALQPTPHSATLYHPACLQSQLELEHSHQGINQELSGLDGGTHKPHSPQSYDERCGSQWRAFAIGWRGAALNTRHSGTPGTRWAGTSVRWYTAQRDCHIELRVG